MNKILRLCEKNGFLRPFNSKKSLECLSFGPTGELLVNNIKDEWVYSCVTNTSTNVFPFYGGSLSSGDVTQDTKDSFSYVKTLCRGYLPFGLAEIRHQSDEIYPFMRTAECKSKPKENAFKPTKGMVLRLILFVSPDDASHFFTTFQRERKIWWRKFSSSPGRFKLSEVTSDVGVNGMELPGQSVQILADFEWGTGFVETVRLWSASTFASHGKLFELRDGKHSVLPCALESVLSLDVAALVYLCDAFDDKTEDQVMMRIHRRIAPFKVSFIADVSKNLLAKACNLAQHLTLVLRRAGHATLLLPKLGEEPLKSSISSYNQIGVPFTIVIADSSLSDGIIGLYSRETSLQEQVHITQLVDYMNQLLNAST